jgi:methylthioribose-1-phosphate isomerase
MGMALAAREAVAEGLAGAGLREALQDATEGLFATRPTAYNLQWALDEMRVIWQREDLPPEEIAQLMQQHALQIYEDDLAACRAMGEHGADFILPAAAAAADAQAQAGAGLVAGEVGDIARSLEARPPVILTHCNAGALATAGYGTALGVVRSVFKRAPQLHVLVDETRPFLQGARLTSWELVHEGISAELITDSMAGHFLASGEVTHVLVGADRIAANGDTANKIGTYTLSVLAREHGVPFLVAAPFSTVDFSLPDGSGIPIEERAPTEVTHLAGRRLAPEGMRVRNPAFDVTPAANITAIITERGIARPPFGESLRELAGREVPARASSAGGSS